MDREHETAAVILAAGEGTRMESNLAKVLHGINGRPMVEWVIDAVRKTGTSRIIVVVGHQAGAVMSELEREEVEFAVQKERLGTGHAVMQAARNLEEFEGTVMVLTGDTPLLSGDTLRGFLEFHVASGASGTVLSATLEDPGGYGRILRGEDGALLGIVEHKDASEREREIDEINSGIFCFEKGPLFSSLGRVNRGNVQGEYYLTDVMEIMRKDGRKVAVFRCPDPRQVVGVNDRRQLEEAERMMRRDG